MFLPPCGFLQNCRGADPSSDAVGADVDVHFTLDAVGNTGSAVVKNYKINYVRGLTNALKDGIREILNLLFSKQKACSIDHLYKITHKDKKIN